MQSDEMDCGPVSLRIIAHFHGRKYSTAHLRDLCNISTEGVSMLGIAKASESIGLRSLALRVSYDDLLEKIPLPCIIHWDYSHFVVLYRTTKGKAYISDPRVGLVSYDRAKFCTYWKKNSERGYALVLEPGASFNDQGEDSNWGEKTLDHGGYLSQLIGLWRSLYGRFAPKSNKC